MFPVNVGIKAAREKALRSVKESSSEEEVEESLGGPDLLETDFPMRSYPHCPLFIPSKGRSDVDKYGTIPLLVKDMIPFTVVVEKADEEGYSRLIDSLVFRYFGESHMSYSARMDDELEAAKDTPRTAKKNVSDHSRRCACCTEVHDEVFGRLVSSAYHHGYVFEPLQYEREDEAEFRSSLFTLHTVEEVRKLFVVEVLPEENKGVSYVRNYILHVLVPRIMIDSYVDEAGHLEELDLFSSNPGLGEGIMRKWNTNDSTLDALQRRRHILEEKRQTPRVHGLVGYYWVMDDDIHSFVIGSAETGKNSVISARNMMCDIERRLAKMEKNASRKATPVDPNGTIFTCKEEALINNYTAPGQALGSLVTADNFEHLDKTAIISLEYSRYVIYEAYDDSSIAVNSYNNIACLFRYDLLHIPTTKSISYFPPHASGVRTTAETLVGYCGNMMWYRFAVREDYDFTLQLIARGFYTLRFRKLGFDVPQMSKLRGGMTDYYRNCQSDLLEQNKRFVQQWPSISQRCLKGKNSTRREDIRIRWDLLHPAKARYPGAYLYLRELLPQIVPVNVAKMEEELLAAQKAAELPSSPVTPAREVIPVEASPSVNLMPLEAVKTSAVPNEPENKRLRVETESETESKFSSRRPIDSRWKGFAVERWRDINPEEAATLGLTHIPSSQLRVGNQVAVIPPSFDYEPSLLVAILVDATRTLSKHSALCARLTNEEEEEEVIEWSAVAEKVRGIPMLTVVHCYQVPSEPLNVVADRIDAFFSALPSMESST